MTSKNCQKVVLKALGHILYGSNFIASDVRMREIKDQWHQFAPPFLCQLHDLGFYQFSELCS